MRFDEITIAGRRKRKNRKDRVTRMVQKHLHHKGRKVDEAEGKNTHLEHLEDEGVLKFDREKNNDDE